MRRNKVILATIMMLSCGFITPVHAEDVTSNGTTEVTITKTIPSTYTVSIPKQFDLGTDEMFYVEVIGNIAPTEVLKVSADSDIIMKKQGDDKYEGSASFSFGGYSWQSASLVTGGRAGGRFTFDETQAGVYTGTVVFDVKLEKKSN